MPHQQRLATILGFACLLASAAHAGSLSTPYTDTQQFTKLTFGAHSHWAQPWRAYLETVPATAFLNGTGMNWNLDGQNPDLVAHMLARHGIHHIRIEIGWGSISPTDETQITNATALGDTLRACKKYGLRPLILLNANQGAPCPLKMFSRTITATTRRGDTTVHLDDTSGLRVGFSGLSNLSDYWAAEAIVTRIDGGTVTLSKPLPKDLPAGAAVPMATLKYRPFAKPGSNDYQATIAGWRRYVGVVDRFASSILGDGNGHDKGFDMEIWNELTFGSRFLSINNYYSPPTEKLDEGSVWSAIIRDTAAYADAHSADFVGVGFGDGFANTIPWPASSNEPSRVTAIDKHPYHGRVHYPQDNNHGDTRNALYASDPFVPTYTALFPEYFATALQTEFIEREAAPITSDVYGTKHGRLARTVGGRVVPCTTWITEVNIAPNEDQPGISRDRALSLKAKNITRYFCFYLNKGVTQLDIFAAAGGDTGLGVVLDSFLGYAKVPNAPYPADDTALTSPALAAVGRIAGKMREGLDPALTVTRPLRVTSLSDTHDHAQFRGDGTPAHPDLYDRDVFAFLPYQVNARRFVIPYYVMTRDVARDLPDEAFTLTVQGLHGVGAVVTAYDPIGDVAVPVTVTARRADSLTLRVTAGDAPYLLTVQEATPGVANARPKAKPAPPVKSR